MANFLDFLSSSFRSLSEIFSALPDSMKFLRTPTKMNGRTKVEWSMDQKMMPEIAEQVRVSVSTLWKTSGTASPFSVKSWAISPCRALIASGKA